MKKEPIINWRALQSLCMPAPPPEEPDADGHNMWDNIASSYNKMSSMEKEMTVLQVEAMPLEKEMRVLDLGCGCGRLTVPVAKRVKQVTALDSSRKMLSNCMDNVKHAGLNNVTGVLLDIFDAKAGRNIPVHDFAFCSRSVALWDIERLSSFARKYAAIDIWANGPSIPELTAKIFEGTSKDPITHSRPESDRRIGYNVFWNMIYDLGYEPNISILPDGFKAFYSTREEAYKDLKMLGRVDEDRMEVYKANVDRYMTEKKGGFEFFLETRSCIIWWETHPKRFF